MFNFFLSEVSSTSEVLDSSSASEIADSQVITWNQLLNNVIKWASTTGIKVLVALLILVLSFNFINFITKKIYKKMKKRHLDETISRVALNITRFTLKLVILVCLVAYVGIETASVSAIIASLGVGISLAVQGTLSNFAGGVIIIIMRPFKLGDFITSNDHSGTVEDIKLFYTSIITPDNKVVLIPNGTLANNVIVNVSTKESRRVDVVMPVSYSTNIEKAKKIIKKVCAQNEEIFKTPEPFIKIGEYGDSSINIFVRVWTKNSSYWDVNYYLLDEIKKAFDKSGIEIPFNQIDVTIKK